MKQIPLTRGKFALVDDDDFDRLSKIKWHCGTSKFLGVSRHTRKDTYKNGNTYVYKRWLAHININGKAFHLGVFVNEEDAAKAYDAAAKKHHGEFARLNFKQNG